MIVDVTSESSPTRSERDVVVKSTPTSHAVSANVSKEFSNYLCVVAMNDLAVPLLFLGFEEEDGHLRTVHFGTSGGSRHANEHSV
jgi:hypothetical protein